MTPRKQARDVTHHLCQAGRLLRGTPVLLGWGCGRLGRPRAAAPLLRSALPLLGNAAASESPGTVLSWSGHPPATGHPPRQVTPHAPGAESSPDPQTSTCCCSAGSTEAAPAGSSVNSLSYRTHRQESFPSCPAEISPQVSCRVCYTNPSLLSILYGAGEWLRLIHRNALLLPSHGTTAELDFAAGH